MRVVPSPPASTTALMQPLHPRDLIGPKDIQPSHSFESMRTLLSFFLSEMRGAGGLSQSSSTGESAPLLNQTPLSAPNEEVLEAGAAVTLRLSAVLSEATALLPFAPTKEVEAILVAIAPFVKLAELQRLKSQPQDDEFAASPGGLQKQKREREASPLEIEGSDSKRGTCGISPSEEGDNDDLQKAEAKKEKN